MERNAKDILENILHPRNDALALDNKEIQFAFTFYSSNQNHIQNHLQPSHQSSSQETSRNSKSKQPQPKKLPPKSSVFDQSNHQETPTKTMESNNQNEEQLSNIEHNLSSNISIEARQTESPLLEDNLNEDKGP